MQVVDLSRSENGWQRRRANDGRPLHCCCICGRLDVWGPDWTTFCSLKEIDDGTPIPKFCSKACRMKGGRAAGAVTIEMKIRARDAEWREPRLVYREANELEKYAEALHSQKRRRPTSTEPTEGSAS